MRERVRDVLEAIHRGELEAAVDLHVNRLSTCT